MPGSNGNGVGGFGYEKQNYYPNTQNQQKRQTNASSYNSNDAAAKQYGFDSYEQMMSVLYGSGASGANGSSGVGGNSGASGASGIANASLSFQTAGTALQVLTHGNTTSLGSVTKTATTTDGSILTYYANGTMVCQFTDGSSSAQNDYYRVTVNADGSYNVNYKDKFGEYYEFYDAQGKLVSTTVYTSGGDTRYFNANGREI